MEGFGDRGYGLCDEAAILEVLNDQSSAVSLGFAADSPVTWIAGRGCQQTTMQFVPLLGFCWPRFSE